MIKIAKWLWPSLLFCAAAFAQSGTFTSYTTTWANRPRQYGVYVPPSIASHPSIMLYLHGTYEGPATPWQAITQWKAMANANKYIVVWPLATYQARIQAWYWDAYNMGFSFASDPDDAGFVCNLIPALVTQFSGNPKAVFVTGMSSGAMLTQRVGMMCPEKIAAIAPVSGQIYIKQMADPFLPPLPVSSISVLEIHGDADPVLQYCGARPHSQWSIDFMTLPSVDQDMTYWQHANACLPPDVRLCTDGSPTPNVYGLTSTGCRDGVEVQFIDNPGGGHVWPSWAYETISQFFATHEKQ
jgi:polyhydroxybutyrate depolymerase